MALWAGILSEALPQMATAAMVVSLFVLLVRYFLDPGMPGLSFSQLIVRLRTREIAGSDVAIGDLAATRRIRRSLRRNEMAIHHQLRVLARVFTLFAASRLIIFAAAAFGCWQKGELANMLHNLPAYWVRWDAPHYIGLANNWYVTEGDARLHLVFLPLYPLVVRILKYLFLGNTYFAASFVSNACLLVSGWALYHITFEQQGERAAWRSVRYLMFCPLSVFFSVPYTESMFLMLTLLSVLLARRRAFWAAVAIGALASATRALGLITAVPIFLEMLRHTASRGLWPEQKKRHFAQIARYTLMVSLVSLGFAGYLVLNWHLTGNPLQFLIYQSEHWGQQFGTLWDSLRYTLVNAFTYAEEFWRLGTWVPQSIAIVAVVALLTALMLRIHPGDGAYAWLYLFAALAPTWLLSGPRYIAGMYALYPMLSMVTTKKWQDIAMTGAFVSLMVLCSYMYVALGNLL